MDNQTNANVVLSADVSGYQSSIQAATKDTNTFLGLVDKVATRLDGLSKRVGKRITLFSAADLAAMTGFTVVAARYEKQLSTINVTLSKGQDDISKYSKGINELTRNSSKSRGEIVALTSQIRQLGITSQAENKKLAGTFLELAKATNSSLPTVTAEMIEFSRQMGTMGSSGADSMRKLSDSLVTVSQNTGTSAEGIINFAQAIAPIAKVAGITATEVLGISSAFNRIGVDGYAAGNTFNTMVSDIARSTRNGSPDLLKYANLVGKSMDEFKKLDPAEQIVQIFESINKAGPDAVNILDQLGFDGIRAAKSIQAVASQAGGLRAAVSVAKDGYDSGATKDAAARGKSFEDTMSKAKNSVEQMASAIGEGALPPMTALVGLAQQFLDKITPVVEPFAKIAGFVGTIAGGIGTAAGPLISQLGMFSKVGMAAWAYRGIKGSALTAGLRDSRTGEQSEIGKQNDAGKLGPIRSRMYESGLAWNDKINEPTKRMLGGTATAVATAPFTATRWFANWNKNFYQEAGGWGKADPGQQKGTFTTARRNLSERIKVANRSAFDAVEASGEKGIYKRENIRLAAFSAAMQKSAAASTTVSGGFSKLALAAYGATSSLTKMSAMNIAQGTRNIASAGGALISRGASSALGMVGGPMGAAALGGMALYSGTRGAMDSRDEAIKKVEATTSRYDAALGVATASVTTFADSLKNATNDANAKDKTAADVISEKVTEKEKSDASSKDYSDSRVKGLTTKQGALGYLQSLGPLDNEHAVAVRQDMVKRFGTGAQDIFSTYGNSNTSSDNKAYKGSTENLLMEAASQQNKLRRTGGLGESLTAAFISPGDAGNESINQAWMAAQQRASFFGGEYNDEVSGKARQAGLLDFARGSVSASSKIDENSLTSFRERDAYVTTAGRTLEDNMPDLFGGGKGKELLETFSKNNNDTEKAVQEFLKNNEGSDKYDQYKNLLGSAKNSYKQELEAAANDKESLNPEEKKFRATAQGSFMESNSRVREATNSAGSTVRDPSEISGSVAAMTRNALTVSKDDLSKAIGENLKALEGQDANSPRASALNSSISELLNIDKQRSVGRSRSENWQSQANIAEQLGKTEGPNADQYKQQSVQMYRDIQSSFSEFVKGMVQAQKQFDLSMKRQKEGFDIQNKYATEDFHRQQSYANEDFLRDRNRQQADYDKQMKRQIEDAAKTMYDPYSVMQAEYTTDTESLLENLKEQQEAMLRQVANLAKAKKMGLSNSAIDLLGLADPSKAQQLDRMMEDFATNPSLINKLNKSSKGREKAAGKLVKNDANSSYRRQEEDRKQSLERTADDFERSMQRGSDAFDLSMKRGRDAMQLSILHAKEDFALLYDEITGSSEKNYQQASDWLTNTLGPGMASNLLGQMKSVASKIPGIFADYLPPGFTIKDGKIVGGALDGQKSGITGQVGQGGSWQAPIQNLNKKKSSAGGNIAMQSVTTSIAEQGPEAVIPLNSRGEQFMANMMKRATAEVVKGMITSGHRTPLGGGGQTIVTSNNSYFTVDKVVAQDPNEMARKMKEKERLQALRRPVNKK